jgi:hypothetical protein
MERTGDDDTVNANLAAYYWAEQMNRERLAGRAASRQTTDETAADRSRYLMSNLPGVALATLTRMRSWLPENLLRGSTGPLTTQSGVPC